MILFSIIILLLSNSVNNRRDLAILYNRVGMLILVYVILNYFKVYSLNLTDIALHGGLIKLTNISLMFGLFILTMSILVLVLTSFTVKGCQLPEYPLLLLMIIIGALILISSNDLVTMFLALEIQSYGLYTICAIYRNSEVSVSGSLIYYLLGILGSSLILLAIAIIYANTGSTRMDTISVLLNINSTAIYSDDWNISLVLLGAGFMFKIGAAPFHMWTPDVYDAIPTHIGAFVTFIAKVSIFVFFMQLINVIENNYSLTFMILMCSLLSLIVGTVLGLTQYRIKRLLAYSSISHIGFILLALSLGTVESKLAFIFYLMQYILSNLNIWLILVAIGLTLSSRTKSSDGKLYDMTNSPIQLISQLNGYYYRNPALALSLTITIFSFLGIPPLAGFFAKLLVLLAALDKGLIFLTIIGVITSVIGGIYYLGLVKEVFFTVPADRSAVDKITVPAPLALIISVITIWILTYMLMDTLWISMAAVSAMSTPN